MASGRARRRVRARRRRVDLRLRSSQAVATARRDRRAGGAAAGRPLGDEWQNLADGVAERSSPISRTSARPDHLHGHSVIASRARTQFAPIAQALEVDGVDPDQCSAADGRVDRNVQLIHAPTDPRLFDQQYGAELVDVLELQAEHRSPSSTRFRCGSPRKSGRPFFRRRGRCRACLVDALGRRLGTRRFFLSRPCALRRAIHLDPTYGAAHAGLSHAWWWRATAARDPEAGRTTVTGGGTHGAAAG